MDSSARKSAASPASTYFFRRSRSAALGSALAGQAGYTSTVDPILAKTYSDIYATAGKGTLLPRESNNNDFNRQDLSFQPSGLSMRHFFTSRIDYNITQNHRLSLVYNYDKYDATPDFLNNIVPAFPGTGTVLGSDVQGGQLSNRFAGVITVRSQFGSHVTNEGAGRVSYVAREDCAAAAAAVLAGDGHDGRTYDITGPEALSAGALADLYGELSGQPVRVLHLSDAMLMSVLVGIGTPAPPGKPGVTHDTVTHA